MNALKDARSAPRLPSLPWLGRALTFGKSNVGVLEKIRDDYGDIVWIHLVGKLEVLSVMSADGLEAGLRNKDGAFSNRLGWERYLDHVFPGAILAMDGEQHRYHRRILQEAFTRANLEGYVEQMSPVIGRRVQTLRSQSSVSVYPFVKSLALDVATRVFMGAEPGRDADRVNRAFIDAVEASIAILRLPVWPLPFYKHTWVMDEALRLHPPLPFMPRVTVAETEVDGYRVPPGVQCGFAPLIVQRDARHWTRPHAFDPERFSSARAEDKRHPYAFTPFGGGRHLCVGKRFGQLEILSTLHQLLQQVRWSVPERYEMPFQFMPIGKPTDGLPVQLEAV